MKIGIIGSGAIGLYYGSMLQRSGQDVHFLMRRDYGAVSQNGLKIHSVKENFELPKVSAYENSADIGPVDLVLVALKTFSNQHMVTLVSPPLIGPDTAILTLQNGLGNEELLADAFGATRVLGGIAFICSNRGEPGTVHHLGEGKITLGELSDGLTSRSQQLAEMFNQAGVRCEAVDDLRRIRWEKLLVEYPPLQRADSSIQTGCHRTDQQTFDQRISLSNNARSCGGSQCSTTQEKKLKQRCSARN